VRLASGEVLPLASYQSVNKLTRTENCATMGFLGTARTRRGPWRSLLNLGASCLT
jgi:hypothetical protein